MLTNGATTENSYWVVFVEITKWGTKCETKCNRSITTGGRGEGSRMVTMQRHHRHQLEAYRSYSKAFHRRGLWTLIHWLVINTPAICPTNRQAFQQYYAGWGEEGGGGGGVPKLSYKHHAVGGQTWPLYLTLAYWQQNIKFEQSHRMSLFFVFVFLCLPVKL